MPLSNPILSYIKRLERQYNEELLDNACAGMLIETSKSSRIRRQIIFLRTFFCMPYVDNSE
jgi:hypothetical protein